jgi:hypothetical protein
LAPTTAADHTQDTLSVAFSRRKLSLRIPEQAWLARRMSCSVESVYGNDWIDGRQPGRSLAGVCGYAIRE